ncbi:MAG: ribosome assembly cofactor RimP [Bacteroidetes bacterium]|nr:ribosome assembly cofactor RimP [Bacteroidota bacterium]
MIQDSQIRDLVKEKIEGTNLFLVDVTVKPGNKIVILIDGINGLSVDECVKVSRHVEFSLDREAEDFELLVSSPGADSPFKVREQYKKYEGRMVEVITNEGKICNGKLYSSDEEGLEIEMIVPVKGANKKVKATEKQKFNYNQIKQTKATISFK